MDDPQTAPLKKAKLWRLIIFSALLVLVLVAIAVPNFAKSKTTACKNACVNNLRILDGAKEQYALDHKLPKGYVLNSEQEKGLYEYCKGGAPSCPGGGKYSMNPIDVTPTCDSAKEGGHSLAER